MCIYHMSRVGAQMLILQGISLRLAVVNNSLKMHKERRRKRGKEKRSHF